MAGFELPWAYGFVEVKEFDSDSYEAAKTVMSFLPRKSDFYVRKLLLSEIYFYENGKPFFWTPLNWDDFLDNREQILKDLITQSSSTKFIFTESDFK